MAQLDLECFEGRAVGRASSNDGHERLLLNLVEDRADGNAEHRQRHEVGHEAAVEAADVPAVHADEREYKVEQELDHRNDLRDGERKLEVEDLFGLTEDLIEADDDSEIGDDVVLYQHAHRTGDYNTAHAHADHNEQRDELKIDDSIVAAFAWIPDLQVVVAIGAVAADWARVSKAARARFG